MKLSVCLLAAALLHPLAAQETLTNDGIVKLVQGGASQDAIVQKIVDAPAVAFNFFPSSMDQLTKAGVSDDVIRAMAARTNGRPIPGHAASPKPAESGAKTAAAEPKLAPGQVRIHGYITDLQSPTEFQIEDYRINRDSTLSLQFEKEETAPKTAAALTASDLRVGTEVEVIGSTANGGTVHASSIKVYLTGQKRVSRTALLDRTAHLERAGGAWKGTILVDGQRLIVQPSTKIAVLPNGTEKKARTPLPVASIGPDTWVAYKGERQADGSILATAIQFKHNQRDRDEARLISTERPLVMPLDVSSGVLVHHNDRYQLYPDTQLQAYVQQVGNKLVPAYQRNMATGAPDKLNFQFFVAANDVPNAFSLPDGTVVINSGMIGLLENEAQLAAVIGHEISHPIQEHSYRQMENRKRGLLLLKPGNSKGADAAGVEAAIHNGYGPSMEDQADRMGLEYMIDAGYDPREAPRVWKLVAAANGDRASNFFWSDRNNHTTRRSYLMAEIRNNYSDLDYSHLEKGETQFAGIASRVKDRIVTH